MVSVTISPAGKPTNLTKKLPITTQLANLDVTIGDVKTSLAAQFPKLYTSRQKITLKDDKKAIPDDTTLRAAGIVDGGELSVKDLGPQVSWRTVFLVEYGGPLLIHPPIYYLSPLFYGVAIKHSLLQKYVYTMVLLHFAKRELETLFVHRFSHSTMPLMNIFKNSIHYHVFSGVLLALDVYRPVYSATSPHITGTIRDDPRFLWACSSVWLFAELLNLHSHITLRNLRPAGTRVRAIPYGYGFNFVSCPNYSSEIVAWATISVMTRSYASYFFLALSTYQMAVWAIKKHAAYKKEFGKEYPKGRKILVPFIW